jgi:putative N-acetylmannosamine-6-phosphate epimerase
MVAMAQAAVAGGAAGIRANGPDDVAAIRKAVDVPVIGLWKLGTSGVYITPTLAHAFAVAAAGADVVALDGTSRRRPDGLSLAEVVATLHARTSCLVMADVATVEDGIAAQAAGADVVSSTLSGYTDDGPAPDGPDLVLVEALARRLDVPVVAEGRIRTPEEAAAALDLGAWAVVVGGAITRPQHITERFVHAMSST